MPYVTDEIISEGGMTGTTLNVTSLTPSTILSSDSNDNVSSLSTSTYPDLTEISYVKGVTSAIQTQFGGKVSDTRSISTTAPLTGGGDLSTNRTFSITQSTTSTDGYLSSTDWNTFNNKTREVYNAATTPQVISGNAEAYFTNSNISTTTIKAGTIIRWVISCSKTNAGTATPVWRVKFGTASSTADATLITIIAVSIAAVCAKPVKVINVGSGVSAVLSGHYNLTHNLATTGFATLAGNNISGVSGGFNSTTANSFLGISVNPGANAIWTVNQVSVTMSNTL